MKGERGVVRVLGPWRAAVCAFLVMGAGAARAGENAPTVPVDAGARVVSVEQSGDTMRVVLGRGAREGLRVGMDDLVLSPMRLAPGAKTTTVDFSVQLARGRVVAVDEHQATLELRAIAGDIAVDTYVGYLAQTPSAIATEDLLRITALDIGLRGLDSQDRIVTLAELLESPTPETFTAAIGRLTDEVHARAEQAKTVRTQRIEGGRFHGMGLGEAFARTTPDDVADFITFAAEYPGKYIGHTWKLVEVYATWLINESPSGDRSKQLAKLAPKMREATQLTRAGRFADAEAIYRAIIAEMPDHEDAAARLADISRLETQRRRLEADPDDTATRWKVFKALYGMDADALAAKELERLRPTGYEADQVARYSAYLAVRGDRWDEAIRALEKLTAEAPDDKRLAGWLTYARARRQLVDGGTAADAQLQLGALFEELEDDDSALSRYHKALDAATTPEQFRAARAGQERVTRRKQIRGILEFTRNSIRDHDREDAEKRIATVFEQMRELGDTKWLAKTAEELADIARDVSEEELALSLMRSRLEVEPESADAHGELAWALLVFGRYEEAAKVTRAGLRATPKDGWLHLINAYLALAADDVGRAEREAKVAAKDPNYSWAHLMLARTAAARGAWERAVASSARALELNADAGEIRRGYAATQRGRDAAATLKKKRGDPAASLALVRSLADLGLAGPAKKAAAAIRDPAARRDAYWALADTDQAAVPLAARLEAGRLAAPEQPMRQRRLAILEARVALEAAPDSPEQRLALARAWLVDDQLDRARAVLAPLLVGTPSEAAGDLAQAARLSEAAAHDLQIAIEAAGRRELDTEERLARRALAVYETLEIPKKIALAKRVIGGAVGTLGRYEEAEEVLAEAVRASEADGDLVEASWARRQWASVRSNLGDLGAEAEAVRQQLAVCAAADDEWCLQGAQDAKASIALNEGRLGDAVTEAREAVRLAERTGAANLVRTNRFRLADALYSAGRFKESEPIVTALLRESREAFDAENERYALLVLGAIAMKQGDGPAARKRFVEVYALGERSGETGWRALARKLEGQAWLSADGKPDQAAPVLEQAVALYASLDDDLGEADALGLLAAARGELGDAKAARTALGRATELARKFGRDPLVAWLQAELSRVELGEGELAAARTAADEAVRIAGKTDDDALGWKAWHAMARVLEAADEKDAAGKAFDEAVARLGRALVAAGDEGSRAGYLRFGRARSVYQDAIQHFLDAGDHRRAMELLELSRDAQLRELMDPSRIDAQDPTLGAGLSRYESAKHRATAARSRLDETLARPAEERSEQLVDELTRQVARTRGELNQVVVGLRVSNRVLFMALGVDPQNLVQRRASLPEGSLLLQYFVSDAALHLFVISPEQAEPAVFRVDVPAARLDAAVQAYREALLSEPDKADRISRELYGWLLRPLEAQLDTAKTVIIMPFGSLYYLPFHALLTSPEGAPRRYAIERWRIAYETSTTIEQLLAPPGAVAPGRLLAFANPDGSLPGARDEVEAIVRNGFPDGRVLFGSQATRAEFQELAGQYRIVHFATHGVLDADPLRTRLVMAGEPLTVHDIAGTAGMAGRNDLVVLSACQTAMEAGRTTGDELVSLAFAFAMAGAPTLVASLWDVDDEATSLLMERLYKQLTQPDTDKLDALRQAQIQVLRMERGGERVFEEPAFWAAFQLMGDFRRSAL
ncbi:MAG: CHAT domain-containing protein [Deltaproteobacteria bacterium]|nr:CHAT domain-containing protein [Deltaproteobacteria bacterium]MCB9789117.1 CHAT domain-containing protein [Deltaproteobacteria bacterium]